MAATSTEVDYPSDTLRSDGYPSVSVGNDSSIHPVNAPWISAMCRDPRVGKVTTDKPAVQQEWEISNKDVQGRKCCLGSTRSLWLLLGVICRLAKSTLLLIPLLGVHEVLFSFITDDQVQGFSKLIRLFIQLTLSSFHVSNLTDDALAQSGKVLRDQTENWAELWTSAVF